MSLGVTVVALAAGLVACGSDAKSKTPTPGQASSAAPTTAPSPAPTSAPTPAGTPVHIRLLNHDSVSAADTIGVGMPIIAYFSQMLTDPTDFIKNTKVTVGGQPNDGHWYFEKSASPGSPMEAHFRPAKDPAATEMYWPAHTSIHMDMATKGLSGGSATDGSKLVFDNSLTLDMATGAKNITTVDCGSDRLELTSDDKTVMTAPVSCGKSKTPTYSGIKVVMQLGSDDATGKPRKDGVVLMSDTAGTYHNDPVAWSVRITGQGEYIHAADWNGGNIGSRDTSNGCTNLRGSDAKQYYGLARIGDVAKYSNTGGGLLPQWDGYGDWNVSTSTWNGGGLLDTTG